MFSSVAGCSLLDHQIKVLNSQGISDIHVVVGYQSSKVSSPDIFIHNNNNFSSTNMVSTLFCADELFNDTADIIISYGDIVYEKRVLKKLLSCDDPISVVVDHSWQSYWSARMDDPLLDAETLKLTNSSHIRVLGRKPSSFNDIKGQYIGLIKVIREFCSRFSEVWHAMDKNALYDGNTYDNMYMTSFLQYIIDNHYQIKAVLVNNGWLEIDCLSDFYLAENSSSIGANGLININIPT